MSGRSGGHDCGAGGLVCEADVVSIESVLERDGLYVGVPAGVSMLPMLRNRCDTVVVARPEGRLRVGDVALYRSRGSYVLHRVVAVGAGSYTMLGDNCSELEPGVADAQVIGVLTGFFRDGRRVDMEGLAYRAYVRAWLLASPVRRRAMRTRALLARGPVGDVVRAARRVLRPNADGER